MQKRGHAGSCMLRHMTSPQGTMPSPVPLSLPAVAHHLQVAVHTAVNPLCVCLPCVLCAGKLCIEVSSNSKLAWISEELCIGCGICVKVRHTHHAQGCKGAALCAMSCSAGKLGGLLGACRSLQTMAAEWWRARWCAGTGKVGCAVFGWLADWLAG